MKFYAAKSLSAGMPAAGRIRVQIAYAKMIPPLHRPWPGALNYCVNANTGFRSNEPQQKNHASRNWRKYLELFAPSLTGGAEFPCWLCN